MTERERTGGCTYACCQGKRIFRSRKSAAKVSHRYGQRKYLCETCDHWHLTRVRQY